MAVRVRGQCWLRSWLMHQLHTHRLHLPLLSTHSPLRTRQLLHHHSRHLPTFPTTTHQLPHIPRLHLRLCLPATGTYVGNLLRLRLRLCLRLPAN